MEEYSNLSLVTCNMQNEWNINALYEEIYS